MSDNIKIRAHFLGHITEVKMLISHPMETGRRKNAHDEIVPAHFIQNLEIRLNQEPRMIAQWGTGIAKNPYLTIHLKDAKVGDQIDVIWIDNFGQAGQGAAKVVLP